MAESVRDLKLEAQRDHLTLAGQLDARARAVLALNDVDDYDGARRLAGQLKTDLDQERQQRDAAKKRYTDNLDALQKGGLATVPGSAPQGLEKPHQAVNQARARLPANPLSLQDFQAAEQALDELTQSVTQYGQAKDNLDKALSRFSSAGTEFSQIVGHDKLNTLQKSMVDTALKKKAVNAGKALSDTELKSLVERIVEKTNKLAETPLETGIPGINVALAKSETLKNNIIKLQKAKWAIVVNQPGEGSYCDKHNKTIAIDPNDTLESSLGGLAHETGHALFDPPPKPSVPDQCTVDKGIEYVRKCVEVDFLDEGEAQIVACRTAKDMKAAGGQAEVPADSGEFMAIYERHINGDISEDDARKEMAGKFGNLITSTTHENYLTYYGKSHIENWNAAQTDDSTKLDESILATMTLFS